MNDKMSPDDVQMIGHGLAMGLVEIDKAMTAIIALNRPTALKHWFNAESMYIAAVRWQLRSGTLTLDQQNKLSQLRDTLVAVRDIAGSLKS
jgi:hypothetical protein